jgi:YGGT family
MRDRKLATEEARRESRLATIKTEVGSEVNAELAAHADRPAPTDTEKVEELADRFRGKAIQEVERTDQEVERARGMARVSQVVDYAFCVIYGLLAIRLVLGLMAARPGAGFVQFITAVTDPLYAWFRGIVPSPSLGGGATLALPLVIAILVYGLAHIGVRGLLRLIAHRRTEV